MRILSSLLTYKYNNINSSESRGGSSPLLGTTSTNHSRPRKTTQAIVLKAFFLISFSFRIVLHCLSLSLKWSANGAWVERVFEHQEA